MASPGLFGDIWSVQSISTPRHTARSLQLWAEQARLLSAGELFHGLNRENGLMTASLHTGVSLTPRLSLGIILVPRP